jgi:hypothetical protein
LAPFFPELDLIELLGRGGMGAVYKARQKSLDRLVALKILPPAVAQDPAFSARFVQEAQALARLAHPHIVTIHDFGTKSGPWPDSSPQEQEGHTDLAPPATVFYFLMEYVDGTTLRRLLEAETVAPADALAIVPQICDALQYAHDRGIVHRDIKPENILLNRRGEVKIADFGLAKLVGGHEPSGGPGAAALAASVAGTPAYMAPEQAAAPAAVDHRADIYAVGVVFYQLLTGELPPKDPARIGGRLLLRLYGGLVTLCLIAMLAGCTLSITIVAPRAERGGEERSVGRRVAGLATPELTAKPRLSLADDFSDPAASAARWTPLQAGTATVRFEPGRAVLDSPANPAAGNKCQLAATRTFRFSQSGQQVRVAFDMELLEDRPATYGFGVALGEPGGRHVYLAHTGPKENKPEMGAPHDLYMSGVPNDNIDHGMGPLHFDFLITCDDPASGAVLLGRVYKADDALAGSPENYAARSPEAEFTSRASLSAGSVPFGLWFFVEQADVQGDPYTPARGKIAISHVYVGEGR